MIEFELNGDRRSVRDGTAIGTVIDAHAGSRAGMAAARNGEVVPRSQWDVTPVQPGDRIELLAAAQGG